MPTLHLTNGTSVGPSIRQAGIEGRIVPWEDVLHEGPVPAGLGPAALRERRADFLARCGWGGRDDIARDLAERDETLDRALGWGRPGPPVPDLCEEIVLWFEHDLFDQLQFVQILDRLPVDGPPAVTRVTPPTYLGHEPPERYAALHADRRGVTSTERLAGRDAWEAFRSPDPHAIVDVLSRVSVLPHLPAALSRHLEQLPATRDGLSRTERQALEVVASGVTRLGDVFQATQGREEAMFMGDAAFLYHVAALIRSSRPLLVADRPFESWHARALECHVTLTADGEAVLAGRADRVRLCGIDRWLGGVQVSGTGPVWRWDSRREALRFA